MGRKHTMEKGKATFAVTGEIATFTPEAHDGHEWYLTFVNESTAQRPSFQVDMIDYDGVGAGAASAGSAIVPALAAGGVFGVETTVISTPARSCRVTVTQGAGTVDCYVLFKAVEVYDSLSAGDYVNATKSTAGANPGPSTTVTIT